NGAATRALTLFQLAKLDWVVSVDGPVPSKLPEGPGLFLCDNPEQVSLTLDKFDSLVKEVDEAPPLRLELLRHTDRLEPAEAGDDRRLEMVRAAVGDFLLDLDLPGLALLEEGEATRFDLARAAVGACKEPFTERLSLEALTWLARHPKSQALAFLSIQRGQA